MFLLSDKPQHHPDCCLSLSIPLLCTVRRYAQHVCRSTDDEVLLLSIGAGTGLFESYLKADFTRNGLNSVKVEAVEVQSAVIPYLPADLVHRVLGSWGISNQAHRARILLFVYPRDPHLVRKYLHEFGGSVQYVLWFGPRIDWVEYEDMSYYAAVFEHPVILEHAGLASYELAAAFENKKYKQAGHASDSPKIDSSEHRDIDSI